MRIHKSIIQQNNVTLEVRIPAVLFHHVGPSSILEELSQYGIQQFAWRAAGIKQTAVINLGPDLQHAVVLTEFLIARVLKPTHDERPIAYVKGLARNPKAHPGLTTE
jgi:hypothetical protein